MQLAPGFPAPPNTDYSGYHQYIEDAMPAESPYLYGLHPNAEIGFLTTTSESLFRTIFEMQPRDAQASGATTVTREDKVVSDIFLWSKLTNEQAARLMAIIVSHEHLQHCSTCKSVVSF